MEGGGRKKTRGMARTYVINFETNFKYVLVRKEKKPTQGSNKNLIVVIASRASEDALSASAIITLATTNIGVRISAGEHPPLKTIIRQNSPLSYLIFIHEQLRRNLRVGWDRNIGASIFPD